MKEGGSAFGQSGQESSTEINSSPIQYVSVLKHLPPALPILQGGQCFQLQQPICVYPNPLLRLSHHLFSKDTQNNKLPTTHLNSIEATAGDHLKMKQKIKNQNCSSFMVNNDNNNNKNINNNKTLWSQYSKLTPVYNRFPIAYNKHNFANVFLNIPGIQISLQKKCKLKNSQDQVSKQSHIPNHNSSVTHISNTTPCSITFQSNFQSGNLLYAFRKDNNGSNGQYKQYQTYDLVLQNDTNTRGHNQWFFFRIRNNNKQGLKVRFNIVNLIKDDSAFCYGIKPLTFSERMHNKHGIGWIRDGYRVNYEKSQIIRENNNNKYYYCLSFDYLFRQPNDTVYFAPHYPYTCSQLTYFLKNQIVLQKKSLQGMVMIQKLTQTYSRNRVNILTFATKSNNIKNKYVWIIGRQHPGETIASFMIEAIIKHLIQLVTNNDKKGTYLDNYVFKVVPMLNVDGVIHGNSRAELTGIDSNRAWLKPTRKLAPGVIALKKLMIKHKQQTALVIDLHSHSKKTGCFFYGNTVIQSGLNTSLIYPSLVCKNDERFTFKFCRFQGGYDTTARKILFHNLGIPNIFTLQCSMLGYLRNNRLIQYKINDYHEMAVKLIDVFLQQQQQKQSTQIAQITEFADAGQARSQSQLSDQQYAQLSNQVTTLKSNHPYLLRNRHNLKSKPQKINKKSLSRKQNDSEIRSITHLPQRTLTHNGKRFKNTQINTALLDKKHVPRKKSLQQQLSNSGLNAFSSNNTNKIWSKTNKIRGMVNQTTLLERNNRQNQSTIQQIIPSVQDKYIQVDIQQLSKCGSIYNNESYPRHRNNTLCVFGNSIQQENFGSGKSGVCLQVQCPPFQHTISRYSTQKINKIQQGIELGLRKMNLPRFIPMNNKSNS